MYVCMYVCTYVRTYVCMYVCMYLVRLTNRLYANLGLGVPNLYWQLLSLQLENFTRPKRTLQSYVHRPIAVPSLSLPSVPNFSAHPIAIATYIICTCYTLSSSCGLWPISLNPAIMQPSGHFPFPASTVHVTPCTYKQLNIATLHLRF